MIPIIVFLGLDPQGFVIFQIVQTIINFMFVFLLISFVLMKLNPHASDWRKLLITALSIEGIYVISFFICYFLMLYAMGGFIIELLFLFLVPFFVIYLLYTQNSDSLGKGIEKNKVPSRNSSPYLSTGKCWLLYACSVPPALILSCLLTSVILNLFGIQNTFIFS